MYYVLLLFFVFEYVRPGSCVRALNVLHLNSIIPFVLVLGSVASGGAVAAFRDRNVHLAFTLQSQSTVAERRHGGRPFGSFCGCAGALLSSRTKDFPESPENKD